jgi:hypothetical protein
MMRDGLSHFIVNNWDQEKLSNSTIGGFRHEKSQVRHVQDAVPV